MKKKSRQKLVTVQNSSGKNLTTDSLKFVNSEIRPNDYKVIDLLGQTKAEFTFRGIMRKLGIHQETLSRSLYRLNELGIISKTDFGYKINVKTEIWPTNTLKNSHTPILLSYLPSSISKQKIIDEIAGKWFKNLRWVGIIIDDGKHILQWADNYELWDINLCILSNHIVIETSAKNEKDRNEAMIGACNIMQKISELYMIS